MRSALPLLLLLAAPPLTRAQAPDPRRLADSLGKEINAAWLAADQARLLAARRLLDRAVTLFPQDGLLRHYQGYAIYRLLQSQPEPSEPTRTAWLSEALTTFAASAKLLPLAESHALRRALLAQTISDAGSAMAVVPQMEQEAADALRLGKQNPRVWLVQGVGLFFTPPTFGGGAESALADLTKAEEFFKYDHPGPALPAWGRAELAAWLGIVHQKLGHTEAARRSYQEALRLEPGFGWVRGVLLPGLERGVQPFPEVP